MWQARQASAIAFREAAWVHSANKNETKNPRDFNQKEQQKKHVMNSRGMCMYTVGGTVVKPNNTWGNYYQRKEKKNGSEKGLQSQ